MESIFFMYIHARKQRAAQEYVVLKLMGHSVLGSLLSDTYYIQLSELLFLPGVRDGPQPALSAIHARLVTHTLVTRLRTGES